MKSQKYRKSNYSEIKDKCVCWWKSDLFCGTNQISFSWKAAVLFWLESFHLSIMRSRVQREHLSNTVPKLKILLNAWIGVESFWCCGNSFYNRERCFIAGSIEFKWAPGNLKFVTIENRICQIAFAIKHLQYLKRFRRESRTGSRYFIIRPLAA